MKMIVCAFTGRQPSGPHLSQARKVRAKHHAASRTQNPDASHLPAANTIDLDDNHSDAQRGKMGRSSTLNATSSKPRDSSIGIDTGLGLGFGGTRPKRPREWSRSQSDPSLSQESLDLASQAYTHYDSQSTQALYRDNLATRKTRPPRANASNRATANMEAVERLQTMVVSCMRKIDEAAQQDIARAAAERQAEAQQRRREQKRERMTRSRTEEHVMDTKTVDHQRPKRRGMGERTSSEPFQTTYKPQRPFLAGRNTAITTTDLPVRLRASKVRRVDDDDDWTLDVSMQDGDPLPNQQSVTQRSRTHRVVSVNAGANTSVVSVSPATSVSSTFSFASPAASTSSVNTTPQSSASSAKHTPPNFVPTPAPGPTPAPALSASRSSSLGTKQLGMRRGSTSLATPSAPTPAPVSRVQRIVSGPRQFKPPQVVAPVAKPAPPPEPKSQKRLPPPGVTVLYPPLKQASAAPVSSAAKSGFISASTASSTNNAQLDNKTYSSALPDGMDDEDGDPNSDMSFGSLGIPEDLLEAIMSQYDKPKA